MLICLCFYGLFNFPPVQGKFSHSQATRTCDFINLVNEIAAIKSSHGEHAMSQPHILLKQICVFRWFSPFIFLQIHVVVYHKGDIGMQMQLRPAKVISSCALIRGRLPHSECN